jgi:EpsI family protein
MSYRANVRRLLFVALCLIVPVIANALRALGIILLAYATDHRVATGVDHVIYGWIFFGVVMVGLLAIGRAWREPDSAPVDEAAGGPSAAAPQQAEMWLWSGIAGVAMAGASYAATGTDRWLTERAAVQSLMAAVPTSQSAWRGPLVTEPETQARFATAVARQVASYIGPHGSVELAVFRFAVERTGSELWQSGHQLFDASRWRWLSEETRWVELADDARLPVTETIVRRGRDERVIWSWRIMSGQVVRSASRAKLQALRDVLRHGSGASAAILLSASAEGSYEAAQQRLHDFTVKHYTGLVACLSDNAELADGCAHAAPGSESASRSTQL